MRPREGVKGWWRARLSGLVSFSDGDQASPLPVKDGLVPFLYCQGLALWEGRKKVSFHATAWLSHQWLSGTLGCVWALQEGMLSSISDACHGSGRGSHMPHTCPLCQEQKTCTVCVHMPNINGVWMLLYERLFALLRTSVESEKRLGAKG